jgi:hypothetical protein
MLPFLISWRLFPSDGELSGNAHRNAFYVDLRRVHRNPEPVSLMATAISYETENPKRRSAQERESLRVVFGVRPHQAGESFSSRERGHPGLSLPRSGALRVRLRSGLQGSLVPAG